MVLDGVTKPRLVDRQGGVVGHNRWVRDDRRFTLEHAEKLLGDQRISKDAHPVSPIAYGGCAGSPMAVTACAWSDKPG